MAFLTGYKTYLALGAGAAVIVANKFGVVVPGVMLNPDDWMKDLWTLFTVGAGRSALTLLTNNVSAVVSAVLSPTISKSTDSMGTVTTAVSSVVAPMTHTIGGVSDVVDTAKLTVAPTPGMNESTSLM